MSVCVRVGLETYVSSMCLCVTYKGDVAQR